MSLRRRLERLGGSGEDAGRRVTGKLRDIPGLETREVLRPEGAFLVHEERFSRGHRHGRFRLEEAAGIPGEILALVAQDPGMAEWGLERAVFLDTETTGLAGGAGTYVFLVGVGWFEHDAFVLRQYFMRDHREERAMLAALAEDLDRFHGIVTFHGKSFDAPRILDRMRALHLDARLPTARHLDLCVVGRRFWRGKHADGRLQTLEAAECGFRRVDDLPGAECPEAWFSYLRGEGRLVARVFEHNRDDILSLATLAARVGDAGRRGDDERDRLVRAKLLVRSGRKAEAAEALRTVLEGGPAAWIRRHALRELAPLLRREGDAEGAAACWSELRREDPADVTPLVEIAKHLEHRRRDPRGALEVTEEAIRRAVGAPATSLVRELEHRRRRLLRKADRSGVAPG